MRGTSSLATSSWEPPNGILIRGDVRSVWSLRGFSSPYSRSDIRNTLVLFLASTFVRKKTKKKKKKGEDNRGGFLGTWMEKL